MVFGGSSYFQWEYSQEIKNISEYHRNMGITSISILNEIRNNFHEMHLISLDIIKTDIDDGKNPVLQNTYEKSRERFNENIEKYNTLVFAKNSKGEMYSSKVMQDEMQKYILLLKQIIQNNDEILKQYENKEITENEGILLIETMEEDFEKVITENLEMEKHGIDQNQSQISKIENEMSVVFIISTTFAIIIAIVLIVLITKFVSVPIKRLIGITEKISEGKRVEIKNKSKNSDVNELIKSINKMSKKIESHKSKIIKQERLSTIGELASRLAHDIRNPLTVIKASLDVMKAKKDLTESELEKFQRVDDAVSRISHQIDNVLDFVKNKPVKMTNQSLNDILNSIILDIPKSENIQITNADVNIKCDFELIKVVLINLIINGIQASGDNGKIKITAQNKDNIVIIQVEDNGPGIPEDKLNKIFEPLFTTKQEGTGLGLASCKSIIDSHGGKIVVKNNPTRFIIELPQNI